MIAFFRRTLASKLALGLLALIMLAFIVTGVFTHELPGASALTEPSGDVLAKVGDRTITVPEMEERVRRQYAQIAQQQPGVELTQFVAGGGFDATVDQTISATALEAYGRKIGLAASARQVDGQIAGISAFQGPTGKFDQAVFRAALAQQHIAEPALRRDIAGDLIRQMLYLPASGAVTLPDGLVRPYAALLVEQRQGTIGLVPAAAMKDGKAPSDAELQSFYKAHLAAYSLPERRVLRYALIGRDQVAAAATPSEAEIRKVYDSKPDQYGARETRTLSQVVLDSQAKADAFAASVKGGKSFAEAAKALGFAAGDIAVGKKTKAQFAAQSSPAVADAAFAAASGGITAPARSALGWHVVKVDAIEKVAATPYAVARPQIAGDLAKSKQDAALAKLINGTQDALDQGTGFADLAARNHLTVVETKPLTAAGLAPDQPGYTPPAELQPLLRPGFQAATDGSASIETIQPGERYALLAVARVLRSAPLPFAQVKARVAADFTALRASERAKAIAEALLAKVKAGTPMAAAFKAAPVPLPPPHDGAGRRIDLAQARMQVPASLKALFTMAAGTAQLVPAEGGQGWYIVQLAKIVPADPKLLAPLVAGSRGDLVGAAGDEYVQQLATAAAKAVGVKRNEAAILALKARMLGATPATAP
ncbi:peptidyl-prolyl cis-trans isomerase [Sphingomonas morindae]|uniref:Parvulin-like PPIase n=1 Tax=Sphingomonas morindae TaxID=1541170 RepID=A0ABY4X4G7_9SPHN|nr:peptidyl-prolyl cis-trans isomerase [Sphingomonas morindae]USI71779.1 peptidyl-prolyl cis-trans isomerase [Sphingomonas morindae]